MIATGLDVVNHVYVVMYNGKLYMEFIVNTVNTFYLLVRRNKTALGPKDRLRLHSKLRI